MNETQHEPFLTTQTSHSIIREILEKSDFSLRFYEIFRKFDLREK